MFTYNRDTTLLAGIGALFALAGVTHAQLGLTTFAIEGSLLGLTGVLLVALSIVLELVRGFQQESASSV